ncbi:hypothetical protein C7212DRAFT_308889 [Tuber magnatum]|uniref:Uncharacterized protein n=1 Tax=Tuber magnatum TaxID=42249 RepID=A0A317SXR3_9PEZI|nr:hypothetical protein C7212DRAFT_308889 [Tuber magnatum]
MPRFHFRHVNPGEWIIAGATIFCGGLLTGMDLLLRSDIKKSEKMIQDTHIEVTLAKVDIKDIKSDITILRSDVSDVKADLVTTRIDLTNQIQLNRRMIGGSPFSFPSDPNRRSGVGNSTDCILQGKGCS